jgi:hypothetical protein
MRQLPQLEMRHFPLPGLVNTKLERKAYGDYPQQTGHLGAAMPCLITLSQKELHRLEAI